MIQYGSILRIFITKMGSTTGFLADYLRGVRRVLGNTRPQTQALPMLGPIGREIVSNLLLKENGTGVANQTAMMIALCYRTASRVSDCIHLTRDSFMFGAHGVAVAFGRTKGNQYGASRADHLVFIANDAVPPLILDIEKLEPGTKLFSKITASSVRAVLRDQHVPADYLAEWRKAKPGAHVKEHFTNHSMKRGAITTLWRVLANVEDPIQRQSLAKLIPVLAKHVPQNAVFPPSTIGYAADLVAVARVLGTETLTRLL